MDYETDVTPEMLNRLSILAQRQLDAEREVLQKEEDLKVAEAQLRQVSQIDLPSLMDEVGIEEFTTTDGVKIKIKEKVTAKIPEARTAEAVKWLEEHGFGGLVKRMFTVEFERSEEDWAKQFERECADRERPLRLKRKESVHHMTLSSFAAEQLNEGEDIPFDLFGVHRHRSAKITMKDKR